MPVMSVSSDDNPIVYLDVSVEEEKGLLFLAFYKFSAFLNSLFQWVALLSSCLKIWFRELQRTFAACALEKKASVGKDVLSTSRVPSFTKVHILNLSAISNNYCPDHLPGVPY